MNVEYTEYDTNDEDGNYTILIHNPDGEYIAPLIVTGWKEAHEQASEYLRYHEWVSIATVLEDGYVDSIVWSVDRIEEPKWAQLYG